MKNTNEKVIITGASDGIGKAMALEFAKRGHSLGLIARRIELLEALKTECEKAGAPKVFVQLCDVTNEAHFEQVLTKLDYALGNATIFIANAGIMGRSTTRDDSWIQVKDTLNVNVMAAIHGLEYMKVRMFKRGTGTLVGVSSIAGARGMPTGGAYSSSKAALTAHLETMRVDMIGKGLSVVTVAPGFIATPMTSHNKGKMPFLMQPPAAAKIFVDGILAKKRWVVAPRPWRFLYPIVQIIPRCMFDFFASKLYKVVRG